MITEGDGRANWAVGGTQRKGPGTSIAQKACEQSLKFKEVEKEEEGDPAEGNSRCKAMRHQLQLQTYSHLGALKMQTPRPQTQILNGWVPRICFS